MNIIHDSRPKSMIRQNGLNHVVRKEKLRRQISICTKFGSEAALTKSSTI